MAEDPNTHQEENKSRALDRPREYPPAPGGYYQYPEEEINLRDYLQVIIHRRWIVITFFIAVVSSVVIGTYMIKPQYQATASLKIDKESSNIVVFKDSFAFEQNGDVYYQTQCKMLTSRNLARRVIRQMKLDSNPEFTNRAAEVKNASFIKPDRSLKEEGIDPSLVSSFISRIVVTPEPKSSFVNVSFISYNPDLAANVANVIAKSFIELNSESKFEATQQARNWLENQLEVMRAKLEQSEEKLNEYASRNGIIFLDYNEEKDGSSKSENIITKRFADVSKELTAATSDRINKESAFNELRNGDPGTSSIVMGNALIQPLTKEYAALESDYAQGLKTYKPGYPKMLKMKEQMDQLKKRTDTEIKKVVASVKKDYEAAVRRENYFKEAFEKYKKEATESKSASVQYQILKREADTNRELYNGLLQKLKETGISASITASNIQVVDRAEVPKSPFKPNKSRNIFLAILIGLSGGIGLAFLTEYLDNTIKTPEDIEKRVYMPSLGLVPLYIEKEKNLPVEYVTHFNNNSHISEAYSSIRTFLLFSTAGKPPKVMMVTSPRREEGKTTTSINTAVSLTKSDARVVIIDADMRRPRLHKVLKVSNTIGLSSFLSGNVEFGEGLVQKTDIPGLDVLPSGPLPPNPAELLGSYRLRDLIDGLYPLYNFIVFDTPPIVGLADAAITSTQTDGVILVVRSGKTPREAVQQAKKILENVNAKVLGVVLNAITEMHMKYGSYSYYQYYYQNYRSDEEK